MRTTLIPDNRGKHLVVVWHGNRRFVLGEYTSAAEAMRVAEATQVRYQKLYERKRAPNGAPAQVLVYTATIAYIRPRSNNAKKR